MRPAVRPLPISLLAILAISLLATLAALMPATASAESIVFLREGNIWRANADGSGQVQITSDGSEASGTYDELSAAKGSGAPLLGFRKGLEFGVIDADGTGERMLGLQSGMPDTSASLSPSGQTLAYEAQEYGAGLWFDVGMTADVASATNSMNYGFFVQWETFANASGSEVLLSQLGEYEAGAAHCVDAEGNEYFQLAYVEVSQNPGVQKQTICKASADEDLESPTMSPDFTKLAVSVSHHAGGTPAEIVVFPRDGTGEGKAITPQMGARYPAWSVDGETIAFEVDRGSEHAIYTVPATGGTPKKVIEDATRPEWTPYGGSSREGAGKGSKAKRGKGGKSRLRRGRRSHRNRGGRGHRHGSAKGRRHGVAKRHRHKAGHGGRHTARKRRGGPAHGHRTTSKSRRRSKRG